MRPIVVIYGPTASGKSALACALAHCAQGVIINADSMQLYRELRVLTARPTPAEEDALPHRLYGTFSSANPASAGNWLHHAVQAIDDTHRSGKLPIVVGGTGLYIRTLVQGMSPIPDVPGTVRQAAAAMYASLGAEAFHRQLQRRDPETAARLHPHDRQRMVRAWELLEHTGTGLHTWQQCPAVAHYAPEQFRLIYAHMPRTALYARCEQRLVQMLKAGALEEVQALMHHSLPKDAPLLRAVGVPELMAHLRGDVPIGQALHDAQQATRRYAKRQLTWMRGQMHFEDAPCVCWPTTPVLPHGIATHGASTQNDPIEPDLQRLYTQFIAS